MESSRIEIPFGGKKIIVETGKLAKQANASLVITCGETTVLVAVCISKDIKEGTDFFPLMVEYQEKAYAAGKIPGGFFKREGRPTQKEILTARLIDRPLRPLFPAGFYNDVVVTCHVLSSDGQNDPDVLAVLGASMVLHISDIPFLGPFGVARVGLLNGEFILNPTYEQRDQSELELFVVGMKDGIVMIEGEAREASDEKVVEGLKFAHESLKPLIDIQHQFQKSVGKPKMDVVLFSPNPKLKAKVNDLSFQALRKAYTIADKLQREEAVKAVLNSLLADMTVYNEFNEEGKEVSANHIKMLFDLVEYDVVREMIFKENKRADGRKATDIRALSAEVDVLPRTHGSALFTRGQTQSLAIVTLGTKKDEQMVEGLQDLEYENFMLHYNFPAFSVGEAKASRGPGRREIGHGALAAKALKGVMPTKDEFPYTVRVVSEILESNGSSSMASVCAGCLSLMAAGVPIKNPVAGISIGLVLGDKNDYRLLTDIMGLEDHHGDMDYKIAGSRKGITAIQLDIKVTGVPINVLAEGIQQAKQSRLGILDVMSKAIDKPRADLNATAPRITITTVPVEKIGEVIGPGGKMIKKIMEVTGAESIDIDDDGKVFIASCNKESSDAALRFINGLVEEPEIGKIYDAKVVKVMNFGAFCEFLPGRQGLVHVSELSNSYVKDVESVVKVGDEFKVKLLEIDKMKRINLSKKAAELELQQQ